MLDPARPDARIGGARRRGREPEEKQREQAISSRRGAPRSPSVRRPRRTRSVTVVVRRPALDTVIVILVPLARRLPLRRVIRTRLDPLPLATVRLQPLVQLDVDPRAGGGLHVVGEHADPLPDGGSGSMGRRAGRSGSPGATRPFERPGSGPCASLTPSRRRPRRGHAAAGERRPRGCGGAVGGEGQDRVRGPSALGVKRTSMMQVAPTATNAAASALTANSPGVGAARRARPPTNSGESPVLVTLQRPGVRPTARGGPGAERAQRRREREHLRAVGRRGRTASRRRSPAPGRRPGGRLPGSPRGRERAGRRPRVGGRVIQSSRGGSRRRRRLPATRTWPLGSVVCVWAQRPAAIEPPRPGARRRRIPGRGGAGPSTFPPVASGRLSGSG